MAHYFRAFFEIQRWRLPLWRRLATLTGWVQSGSIAFLVAPLLMKIEDEMPLLAFDGSRGHVTKSFLALTMSRPPHFTPSNLSAAMW